jgi:hypothetical protein
MKKHMIFFIVYTLFMFIVYILTVAHMKKAYKEQLNTQNIDNYRTISILIMAIEDEKNNSEKLKDILSYLKTEQVVSLAGKFKISDFDKANKEHYNEVLRKTGHSISRIDPDDETDPRVKEIKEFFEKKKAKTSKELEAE